MGNIRRLQFVSILPAMSYSFLSLKYTAWYMNIVKNSCNYYEINITGIHDTSIHASIID